MTRSTVLLQEQAYDYIKERIQEGKFDNDSVLSLNTLAKNVQNSRKRCRSEIEQGRLNRNTPKPRNPFCKIFSERNCGTVSNTIRNIRFLLYDAFT